jgi:hypothetical protein
MRLAYGEYLLTLKPSAAELNQHSIITEQESRRYRGGSSSLTAEKNTSDSAKQIITKRIEIAKQNKQYAWMYANAQQFVSEANMPAARTQLEILWKDAPYYGDPAGLAQHVGTTASLNYEQAIQREQMEREEQARRERERRKQAEATRKTSVGIFTVAYLLLLISRHKCWRILFTI